MLNRLIQNWCFKKMHSRSPDVVIGGSEDPYLLRWWVWPRNKFCNLYLHHMLRSDDDRALHDHPWVNVSYIVDGEYNEVTFDGEVSPPWFFNDLPVQKRTLRKQGTFKFRLPTAAHRLELIDDNSCTTLFLTGPNVRTWGFQCTKGWVPWQIFTKKDDKGAFISRGCGEIDPDVLEATPRKSSWWPQALTRRGPSANR
jgi:hypothetical protein